MRVIILGATGPSGILLVKEYFRVYPTGTAVLPVEIATNSAITVLKGELTDEAALTSAFEADGRTIDAVLSTVGPAAGHPSTLPLTAASRTIISVMAAQGCKHKRDKSSLIVSILVFIVWAIQRNAYNDIVTYSKLVAEECTKHDIDWTLVRVPALNSKPNQNAVAGYVGDGKTGVFLSRHALAEFYVREIEGKEWSCKSPSLSSVAK
ncbi:hypothetical protein FB451DRAFT_1335935 [Mycena latifolia]|nr:hypothetical protein FB451DRAFT_1335935 [Mycena latifolia]